MKKNPWQQNDKKRKLSFKRAMFWILISTGLISGTTALGVLYFFHVRELQLNDERFNISAIEQLGLDKGRLSSDYIAEMLELSSDNKMNLIGFKTDQAELKLQSSPLITSAKVRKIRPDTLSVDYTLRKPLFLLKDFDNAAVDSEGVVFPLIPFFEGTNLPCLYLGNLDDKFSWGQKIPAKRLKLALKIAEELKKGDCSVELIDISRIEAPSYGERQVIVSLTESPEEGCWILRMRPGDLRLQMEHFAVLRDYMDGNASKIVDLRAPSLAFMQDL